VWAIVAHAVSSSWHLRLIKFRLTMAVTATGRKKRFMTPLDSMSESHHISRLFSTVCQIAFKRFYGETEGEEVRR
jgi:hypothetical protein